MLAKRIIPCLDVKDGVVVKGVKFRGHEVVGEIVPLAKRYAEEGADELVFYDITASSDGRVVDKSDDRKVTTSEGQASRLRRRQDLRQLAGARRPGPHLPSCGPLRRAVRRGRDRLPS